MGARIDSSRLKRDISGDEIKRGPMVKQAMAAAIEAPWSI